MNKKTPFGSLKDKNPVAILQFNDSFNTKVELKNVGTVKDFKETILAEVIEECSPNDQTITLSEAFEIWNNEPGLKNKTFHLLYSDGKEFFFVEED